MMKITKKNAEFVSVTFNSFLRDCALISKDTDMPMQLGTFLLRSTENDSIARTITLFCGTCPKTIFFHIGTLCKSLRKVGLTASQCYDSLTRQTTRVFTIHPNICVKIVTCPEVVTKHFWSVVIEVEQLALPSSTNIEVPLSEQTIPNSNMLTNGIQK